MRDSYKAYDTTAIYFITSTVVEWLPVFTSQAYLDILAESIRFCQANKALRVYAYVFMDNHLHLICQSEQLGRTVQSIKRHTAKRVLEQLEADQKDWLLNLLHFHKKQHKAASEHQLWQEGFHPKQILSEEMLRQKAEYIHHNPVRRGLVDRPEHWLYSSAADFLGEGTGPIPLSPWPV